MRRKYIKTLIELINSIIKLIDYKVFEIEKTEFMINNINSLTDYINVKETGNYEELIDSFHFILYQNVSKFFIIKILNKYISTYLYMVLQFFEAKGKNKDLVS